MSKKHDWSIIFVNFNSAKVLGAALRSLAKNESTLENTEIIIVDNASNKSECQQLNKIIDQYSKKIIINSYFLKINIGFGAANNYAAARAHGRYFLFLNPDIIYTQPLLPALADALTSTNVGLVAPLLRLRSGQCQPEAFGHFPTLSSLFSRKLYHRQSTLVDVSMITPQKVDWVCGAAFAVRCETWHILGGFDERFFMYFEDVDLSRRSVAAGFKNLVLPALSLIHLGGERQTVSRWRRRYYFASQTAYFRRWHGRLATLLLCLLRWPYQCYCYFHDPV